MKDKKVGILTLFGNDNYGNRLQNYAVYKLLQSCGGNPENIVIDESQSKIKSLIKNLLPRKVLYSMYTLKKKVGNSYINYLREKNFESFNSDMIFKKFVTCDGNIIPSKKFESFDTVFVGSDQVWNPDFAGRDYYFLDFVEPSKRAAFTASIGYEKLSEEVLERYTKHWKQMHYISVREDSAADIIEKAIGKRPDVFLDPTLLLTKDEWDGVSKKPAQKIPGKYILCLFLGKMSEHIKENYKNKYGMELVILNDVSYPDYYVQGPAEFLWLIKHAELILTDSFHCSVFSIIYHKQFWVFKRDDEFLESMFTRMDTLLTRFDMKDRVQEWGADISNEVIAESRFLQADEIRSEERRRVLKIIEKM